MNKESIKRIIGYKNLLRIKKCMAVKKYCNARKNGCTGRLWYDQSTFGLRKEIKLENKNVFFGYYDLPQISRDESKALVHVVDRSADPGKDAAQLAWFDMHTDQLHFFAETRAWSWQQGARLRWHPTEDNAVLYNDFDGEKYVTRKADLTSGSISDFAPLPLYDLTPDGQHGLNLNFDRLQRLRPGYGYSRRPDLGAGISAPEDDGIYLWDKTGGYLIVSLKHLAGCVRESGVEHYINHIAVSPSGERFMFFHLWSYGPGLRWKMNLYVCNVDGSGLSLVDDAEIISHYSWWNDDCLLTTALANENNPHARYIMYDLRTGSKTELDHTQLHSDGHPTSIPALEGFVSDTYPGKDCMQRIFWDSIRGDEYRELVSVYANPFLIDEHRCDLHPRMDYKQKIICFDTSYTGLRSVVILRKNE